jgi:hypothetical protein
MANVMSDKNTQKPAMQCFQTHLPLFTHHLHFCILFRIFWHHFSFTIEQNQITMKKILFVFLFAAALGSFSNLSAQDYKTSLGVRLSSSNAKQNNSVSIKQFITDKMAIEGLFTFGDPLALGALVEMHKPLAPAGLKYFYGAGGYISFDKKINPVTSKSTTDPNFGAQGIIGLDYKFNNIPLNISLDWKPELNIVSEINFEPAAIGFSARFTFGK